MDRGEYLCVSLGVDAVRQFRQSLVKPAPERETVSHRRRQGDRAEVCNALLTNPARDAPRYNQPHLQPIVLLTETNQHSERYPAVRALERALIHDTTIWRGHDRQHVSDSDHGAFNAKTRGIARA
jgi:hypothetical protein